MNKLLITVILLSSIILIVLSQREVLTFESIGNTKAYKSYNWSYSEPPDLIIAKNSSVSVVSCKDVKTDFLIQIEKNGVIYNISDGSFYLKREKLNFIELLFSPRATFSCKGLFKKINSAIISGNT